MRLEDVLTALNKAFDRLASELDRKRGIMEEERFRRILTTALLFLLAILLAGWPYVFVYNPPSLPYGMAISPDQLGQGSIEALIVGLLYIFCFGAIYWLQAVWSRGRGSALEIIVALSLLTISVLLFYWMGSLKTG